MKTVIVLCVMAWCALAAPPPPPPPRPHSPSTDGEAQVVRYNSDFRPDGSYTFGFETENGLAREETGDLKAVKGEEGKDSFVVVQRGSYAYPGLDGRSYKVNYVADETGFHAEGEHLPRH